MCVPTPPFITIIGLIWMLLSELIFKQIEIKTSNLNKLPPFHSRCGKSIYHKHALSYRAVHMPTGFQKIGSSKCNLNNEIDASKLYSSTCSETMRIWLFQKRTLNTKSYQKTTECKRFSIIFFFKKKPARRTSYDARQNAF